MRPKIIGWDSANPIIEDIKLSAILEVKDGSLWIDGFRLQDIFDGRIGTLTQVNTPLEVVYLPIIRKNIRQLLDLFNQAVIQNHYKGKFLYAYASKANAAEEVVRTVLETGVDYEISSWLDIEIAKLMIKRGFLKKEQRIICNGFKPLGSSYAEKIIELQHLHGNVIPVIEDPAELSPLINSGIEFEVGVRLKTYGDYSDIPSMNRANSRFGMDIDQIKAVAEEISLAPNLTLKLLHGMVGSQLENADSFVDRLTPAIMIFAQLRKDHEDLEIFDFGGGMPAPMTLDFNFDYSHFCNALLQRILQICREFSIPEPHIMGEFGRYTVAEHGFHIFKVQTVKENGSKLPWYIVDGSVMSSFPDIWALGEHFVVLPLNNLGSDFIQVQIGGITCDSDDVYPPMRSDSRLYLPKNADDLLIGFFYVGAYQEMLGGVGGSKHCVIPEADELIVDRLSDGERIFEILPGQSPVNVLKNLGYHNKGLENEEN